MIINNEYMCVIIIEILSCISDNIATSRILIIVSVVTFAAAVIFYIIALSISWSLHQIIQSRSIKNVQDYTLGGAILITLPLLNSVLFIGFIAPAVYSFKKKMNFVLVPLSYIYVISSFLSCNLELLGGGILIIAGDLAKNEVQGFERYGNSAGAFSIIAAVFNTVSVFMYLEYFKQWNKLRQSQKIHKNMLKN